MSDRVIAVVERKEIAAFHVCSFIPLEHTTGLAISAPSKLIPRNRRAIRASSGDTAKRKGNQKQRFKANLCCELSHGVKEGQRMVEKMVANLGDKLVDFLGDTHRRFANCPAVAPCHPVPRSIRYAKQITEAILPGGNRSRTGHGFGTVFRCALTVSCLTCVYQRLSAVPESGFWFVFPPRPLRPSRRGFEFQCTRRMRAPSLESFSSIDS